MINNYGLSPVETPMRPGRGSHGTDGKTRSFNIIL